MTPTARAVIWAAVLAWTVFAGIAVGAVLHLREHPDYPLVFGPSIVVASAIRYRDAHGRYPPDGPVRARSGAPTPWDEVLPANARCSGRGTFTFAHVRNMLRVACESDDRVYVETPAWPPR